MDTWLVDRLATVTAREAAAVREVVAALSSRAPTPTDEALADLVRAPGIAVFAARTGDARLVGVATLVLVDLLTGRKARVEDVVVDQAFRSRGVGRALILAAVAEARRAGARYVDLTSATGREAARSLYESVGFVRRDTAVYRLDLTPRPHG